MKERTLIIIKPDVIESGKFPEIIPICTRGFKVIDAVAHNLTYKQAADFYLMHAGKDFYNRLCDFMSSGRCVAVILEGDNVIAEMRNRIENVIRPKYSETITRNAVHGSDSADAAVHEIRFFFGLSGLVR